MNIIIYIALFCLIIYFFLNWFSKTSLKKITYISKILAIIFSVIVSVLLILAGRYLISLPFLLSVASFVKTKTGITLFQIFRLWPLIKVLKSYGRINLGERNFYKNTTKIDKEEALKILNLDPNKKYTNNEILSSYKKIIKKIHPDINPELTRLATLVNEAKDELLKK